MATSLLGRRGLLIYGGAGALALLAPLGRKSRTVGSLGMLAEAAPTAARAPVAAAGTGMATAAGAGHTAALRAPLVVVPLGAGRELAASATAQLCRELARRTSTEAVLHPVAPARSASLWPYLAESPLAIWSYREDVGPPSPQAVAALRRYVQAGGTLWLDTHGALLSKPGERQLWQWVDALAGGKPAVEIPGSDVLYRSFYRVPSPLGRVAGPGALWGTALGPRWSCIVSTSDVLGALATGLHGAYLLPCEPGGETQREQAIRLAINIVTYVQCLDYKDDQAHVQGLLRRRRAVLQDGASEVLPASREPQ